MNRFFVMSLAVSLALVLLLGVPAVLFAQGDESAGGSASEQEKDRGKIENPGTQQAVIIAIAVMVGMGCVSAAYAVGRIGAAVMGAASEKPEILGRAIIYMGLAEGIAIYGLVVGILLLGKI